MMTIINTGVAGAHGYAAIALGVGFVVVVGVFAWLAKRGTGAK